VALVDLQRLEAGMLFGDADIRWGYETRGDCHGRFTEREDI